MTLWQNEASWQQQTQRWRRFYHDLLQQRLDDIAADIRDQTISPDYYENISEILVESVRDKNNWGQYLELIDQLYPHPVWWGKWKIWMQQVVLGVELAEELQDIHAQAKFRYYLADIYHLLGQQHSAQGHIDAGLPLAQQSEDRYLYFRFLLLDFLLNEDAGYVQNKDEKLAELEKVIELGITPQTPLEKALIDADYILHKSDIVRLQGRPHEALQLLLDLQKSLPLEGEEATNAHAQIHRYLGLAYWGADEYENALANFEKAADGFCEIGNRLFEVNTRGSQGLVLWCMGKLQEAERTYIENIELAQSLKANKWLLVQIGNLGLVYFSMGKLDKADDYMHRHLAMARETDNQIEETRARGNLGIVQLHRGEFDAAIENLEYDISVLEKQSRNIGMACSYTNLAWAYEGKGEREKAIQMAETAQKITDEIDAEAMDLLCMRCMGELEKQEDVLQQALDKAIRLDRRVDMAALYLTLAEMQNRQEYYDKAAAILKEIGAESWLETPTVLGNLRLPMLI